MIRVFNNFFVFVLVVGFQIFVFDPFLYSYVENPRFAIIGYKFLVIIVCGLLYARIQNV